MAQPVHHLEAIAFAQLTDLYQSAHALLASEASACDVVRATYKEAVATRDAVRVDRAWLFSSLLRNVRRKRKGWRLLPGLEHRPAEGADSGDPLLAKMRSMPLEEAEVVMLRDVQEFTIEEIRAILGGRTDSILHLLEKGRGRLVGSLTFEDLPATAAGHSSRGFAWPG